jgi:hypothetical protein
VAGKASMSRKRTDMGHRRSEEGGGCAGSRR